MPIFSQWYSWSSRDDISVLLSRPGIYLLAHSKHRAPTLNANSLPQQIIYIGESCNQTLTTRLNQFDRSARTGTSGHSGGKSYYENFQPRMLKKIFLSFWTPNGRARFPDLYIRVWERKLILKFAYKWKGAPVLNKK